MPDAKVIADDARRLLEELDQEFPSIAATSGECQPPLDVVETTDATEVLVDVPGVDPASLRIAIRRGTVLVVGAKLAASPLPDARFHLAERHYGRFARAVRIAGAFDSGRAKAILANGLLRIVLPRIDDRRGALIRLTVETA